MPAPDLPPPPPHVVSERPLVVHLHVNHVQPAQLSGAVVIVIDALRASSTIAAALAAGAPRIIPCFTVEDAREKAAKLAAANSPFALGGERGGVRIDGFEFDNSPLAYTKERVAGRSVVFTTTNGTAALFHASAAAKVLVGSFVNLTAICDAVAHDSRPVHILCCGTRAEISMDDCLPAGAMVDRLVSAGRQLTSDDAGRFARLAWLAAHAQPGGLAAAMRESRGGRNLEAIGLAADVEYCATIDRCPVVPVFRSSTSDITLDSDASL